MTLKLEYTCTEAERKEAQSLNLERQCGGGPKWRSRLIYYAFVAFLAVMVYLRVKTEIAPKDRPWFIGLVLAVLPRGPVLQTFIMLAMLIPMMTAVFFFISVIQWRSEKKYLTPKHVALTSEGVQFVDRDGAGLLGWTTYRYYLENICLRRPNRFLRQIQT